MTKDRNRYLFKRGGTYYFQKKVNGQMVKRALSTNLTESRRLRDELLRQIDQDGGVEKITAKPETIKSLCSERSPRNGLRLRAKKFNRLPCGITGAQ